MKMRSLVTRPAGIASSIAFPTIVLVDDALTGDECDALRERIESLGPSEAPITTSDGFLLRPDVRNNDRAMFEDVDLAARLFARVAPALPDVVDAPTGAVERCGLNERFRGYRYGRGQRFAPHFDGAFVRDARERSEHTVLFYLSEGFTGGATSFVGWDLDVAPRRGQALIFSHRILHEGCVVEDGVKYVLRTDAMYRRR